MKNKHIIISTILIFAVVIAIASLVGTSQMVLNENNFKEPVNDPIDVSTALANDWLDNINATTSLALGEFLVSRTDVTAELKTMLVAQTETSQEKDVILCQTETPKRVGGKPIYTTDAESQVSIIARGGDKTPNQSIVTLTLVEELWVISDISCSAGEAGGPVGDYSFEQTGRLVKDSVPAPYDSSVWHLIFNQSDDTVQVVQLLFDEASQCIEDSGIVVCNQETFSEGSAAFIQADMTEAGALVRQMDTE